MSATASSYSITMRLHTAPDHGVVGRGGHGDRARGRHRHRDRRRRLQPRAARRRRHLLAPPTPTTPSALVEAVDEVEGVEVHKVSDRTFLLHLGGKIEVTSKVPLQHPRRPVDGLHPGRRPGQHGARREPRRRLAADHQGQHRRRGHRRLRRARPRQHRPGRRAAGDGGQGGAVQAVRRHRRVADLPGQPGHRRDRPGRRDDRAGLRRHQPRGHRRPALLRDRGAAARPASTSRSSTTTSTAPRSWCWPRSPTRCGWSTRTSPTSGSWSPARAPPARRSSPCCSPPASPTSSSGTARAACRPTTTRLPPAKASWPRAPTRARSAATCTTGSRGADVFIGVSAPDVLDAEWIKDMAPERRRLRAGQPRPRGRPRRGRQVRRRGRQRPLRLPQPDQQRAGLPRRLPRPARRPRQGDHPRHAAARRRRDRPRGRATRRSTRTSSSRASSTRPCPRPSPRPSAGGQPSEWQTRAGDFTLGDFKATAHRRRPRRPLDVRRSGRARRQHRLAVRAARRSTPASSSCTTTSATGASRCSASRATSSATRSPGTEARDRGVLRDVVRRDVPDVRQDRRQRSGRPPAVRVARAPEEGPGRDGERHRAGTSPSSSSVATAR